MVSALVSRLVVLFLGTLYPVYGSYKAIRSRQPKEYISWMMYWICFALFSFFETFSDIFLAFCVPFYYELKIIFLVWLLSPLTNGANILYKNFVHPRLLKHEQDIDNMITRTKENGVTAMYQLGTKGAQYASQLLATTAIKGQQVLLEQLHRSYSQGNLAVPAIASESLNEEQVRNRAGIRRRADARRQVVSAPTFSDDSEDPEDMIFQIDEDEGEDPFIGRVEATPPQPKTSTAKATIKRKGTSGALVTFPDTSDEEEETNIDCVRMNGDGVRIFSDSDDEPVQPKDEDPEWRPSTRSKVTRRKPLSKRNEDNNNKRSVK